MRQCLPGSVVCPNSVSKADLRINTQASGEHVWTVTPGQFSSVVLEIMYLEFQLVSKTIISLMQLPEAQFKVFARGNWV